LARAYSVKAVADR